MCLECSFLTPPPPLFLCEAKVVVTPSESSRQNYVRLVVTVVIMKRKSYFGRNSPIELRRTDWLWSDVTTLTGQFSLASLRSFIVMTGGYRVVVTLIISHVEVRRGGTILSPAGQSQVSL